MCAGGLRPALAGFPGYWEFHPFGHMDRSLSTQYLSRGVATSRNLAHSFFRQLAWRSRSGVRHSSMGMASKGKANHVIGSGSSASAKCKKSRADFLAYQCWRARSRTVLMVWPTYHLPVGKWYAP